MLLQLKRPEATPTKITGWSAWAREREETRLQRHACGRTTAIGALLLAVGAPHAVASVVPSRRGRRLECRDVRRDAAVRPLRDVRAWKSCLLRLAVSFRIAISCGSCRWPRNYEIRKYHGPRELRAGHRVTARLSPDARVVAHAHTPPPGHAGGDAARTPRWKRATGACGTSPGASL